MKDNKRLINFEVLRCFSMLMIVYIHFFSHGEKNANVETEACFYLNNCLGLVNYTVSQVLATISMTAVNLFVFITGYFMIESHSFRISKLIKLWMPVVFYSVAITSVSFVGGHIGIHEYLKSFLPIKSNEYWFVTVYFALVLLSPFLAKIANGLSRKSYLIGLGALSFLMLELYKFPYGYTYKNGYGTSLVFFILLFFVGGYFRKFGELFPYRKMYIKSNKWLFVVTTILVSLVSLARNADFASLKTVVGITPNHSFTFIESVVLFQAFLSMKFSMNRFTKLCCCLSPYTFAVYLIHDNNQVRNWLWHKIFHLETMLNEPYYLLLIVIIPFLIYFICIAIDYVRKQIFDFLRVTDVLKKHDYSITIW